MLSTSELKRILNAGSGQRIDVIAHGSASAQRLARAVASLANSDGGVAVVPMPDAAKRSTKTDPQTVIEFALEALLSTEPHLIVPLPYAVMSGDDALAIVIEVPEGLPHVYSADGRYLSRRDSVIAPLSARALRELLLLRTDGVWESKSPLGSASEDISWKKAEEYAALVPQLGEASVEEVLLHRGCVMKHGRKLRPTHAGLLLFGRQPQRWVRGSDVLCARFVGTEMNNAFARQTVNGTLPDQIRKVEAFVAEQMSSASTLTRGDFARQDAGPYPQGVLREAVVNAIGHRDYQATGAQVNLLIFGDRVEVRSPGRLPGHVTLKNLLRERYSRNEAIVQVLADMGFVERLGYGIDRMMRAMKEQGHEPPEFAETEGGFVVTLRSKRPLALGGGAQNPQIERMHKMLNYLREKGRITNREYAELVPDVSAESLRRDFVELVDKNLIMRVGDKRGTYYILK